MSINDPDHTPCVVERNWSSSDFGTGRSELYSSVTNVKFDNFVSTTAPLEVDAGDGRAGSGRDFGVYALPGVPQSPLTLLQCPQCPVPPSDGAY